MRILFITSNRIGDAVLSTCLLRHLTDQHPDARITVACGPVPAPLFGGVPGLERLWILRKSRMANIKLSTHWFKLWGKAVGTRWDMVVDLRRSWLFYFLWAKKRFSIPKNRDPIHKVRMIASTLGLQDNPPAPLLWTNKPHRDNAEKLVPDGAPVLAIGPTANWPGKVWDAENFIQLIERLTAADGILPDARVMVFGAPDERMQAAPVLRAIPRDRRIDLVGKVDLLTAAACMARAGLYIGNDSGLMHMAAAIGTPTLGLFGPSKQEIYGPRGERTAWVRTPESFDELVDVPDYDHRRASSMMGSLTVDRVEQAARELWQRSREETAA